MLASLAGVVSGVLSLRYFDDFTATLLTIAARDNPGAAPDILEEVATLGASVLIGAGVLIMLLQALLALGMVTGRSWARITLVPVGLVGVCYAAVTFGAVPLDIRVGLVAGAVLAIVATVAMFLPGTGVWFERAREYM